jgi:hypothetical protein
MTRLFALILALGLAACASPPATVNDPDPQSPPGPSAPFQSGEEASAAVARFAGTWEGSGTATEADGKTSTRQLFMTMVPDNQGGFALGWATLIDAERDSARLRKTVVQFVPNGPFGTWQGLELQEGGASTLYTASLRDGVLTVEASGTNDRGEIETQVYTRSLDATGTMQLAYRRDAGARTLRRVTGSLRPAPPASTP